jgi:pentatricopeptide repeat protein
MITTLKNLRIYFKIKAKKFEEALHLLPVDDKLSPLQLTYKAHCCFRLKRYDEAKQYYDKLKESEIFRFYAFNNLGYMYLEQFLFDKAIIELDKAREITPEHSFALNNLGFAYMMTGRLEEGIKLVEHTFQVNRHNYYAIRNMGVYCLLKKQYTEALVILKKAKVKDKTIDDIDNYILLCNYKTTGDGKEELVKALTPSELIRFNKLMDLFPGFARN